MPDPATRGPALIQIGTEGGFLPAPVVLPNQPVTWNLDPTMFNVGNVLQQTEGGGTLILGPAERADVIVDFYQLCRQDPDPLQRRPDAFPALDPHYDYYTGAPDRRADMGGAATMLPGMGPNIRTVMQIVVTGQPAAPRPADAYNASDPGQPADCLYLGPRHRGAFATSQDRSSSQPITGQTAYNTAYNTTFPATWPNWGISRISDTSHQLPERRWHRSSTNFPMKPKAIQDEMGATFDDYGRMSAKLGLEVPFTNAAICNFVLQNYVDPATEIVDPNEVQIWKITHNGVDTHPIHFHLFDVQVINRVGWDGFIGCPTPTNWAGRNGQDQPAGGHDRRVEADRSPGALRAFPTASGR